MNTFDTIFHSIAQKENYVPRNYKTIGGMWTVDTWEKDGVKVQLMDEGYTRKIYSDCVEVTFNEFNGMVFYKGSLEDLENFSTCQNKQV